MPFIGRILHYAPDREIAVEHVLDLKEDLYLNHHMFIHAPGLKPPSACLPVLPLTFGLEMMAEVAACLAPGHGCIGFENVLASRWIELKDVNTLALEITGRLSREDLQLLARFVEVKVFIKGDDTPALTGTVCFGRRYLLSIRHRFDELADISSFFMTPERLYRERHLFHGPLFHCISAIRGVGDQGLVGEITVPSGGGLFRSLQSPQLLTAPIVLDGLLQLSTALAMGEEWRPLPMSIEKLETYCPTPAAGTRLPVHAKVTRIGLKRLSADFEVQDGSGMVWARIRGCTFWMFDWKKKIIDYFRLPQNHLLCSEQKLPLMPRDAVCQTFGGEDLHDLNLDWLARISLHVDEMDTFFQFGKKTTHQRHWLFGRVAAKDAVRLWLARQASSQMLHPAAFSIVKGPKGPPVVENPSGAGDVPQISITHANDRAIAIVHKQRLGIDMEVLEPRDAAFLE
ncbi:MAG: polyketide synthase dehydratase domain-containing protein, partial [Deltaproteobacteria bacterium]|nr:polyketide synthase dehydratase domain-containing protein [Deltaproteobacteria bacterium]